MRGDAGFLSPVGAASFCGAGLPERRATGLETGELYLGRDSILLLTTVHPGVFHFNSTRVTNLNGTSAASLTQAEIDGRKQVMSLSQFSSTTCRGSATPTCRIRAFKSGYARAVISSASMC